MMNPTQSQTTAIEITKAIIDANNLNTITIQKGNRAAQEIGEFIQTLIRQLQSVNDGQ